MSEQVVSDNKQNIGEEEKKQCCPEKPLCCEEKLLICQEKLLDCQEKLKCCQEKLKCCQEKLQCGQNKPQCSEEKLQCCKNYAIVSTNPTFTRRGSDKYDKLLDMYLKITIPGTYHITFEGVATNANSAACNELKYRIITGNCVELDDSERISGCEKNTTVMTTASICVTCDPVCIWVEWANANSNLYVYRIKNRSLRAVKVC